MQFSPSVLINHDSGHGMQQQGLAQHEPPATQHWLRHKVPDEPVGLYEGRA